MSADIKSALAGEITSVHLTRPLRTHFNRTYDEFSWRAHELFGAVPDGRVSDTIGERYPLKDAAQDSWLNGADALTRRGAAGLSMAGLGDQVDDLLRAQRRAGDRYAKGSQRVGDGIDDGRR